MGSLRLKITVREPENSKKSKSETQKFEPEKSEYHIVLKDFR